MGSKRTTPEGWLDPKRLLDAAWFSQTCSAPPAQMLCSCGPERNMQQMIVNPTVALRRIAPPHNEANLAGFNEAGRSCARFHEEDGTTRLRN